MAKPERNDPCPCGSGKKFKKCHGAAGAPRIVAPADFEEPDHAVMGSLALTETSATVDLAGFPGQQQHWVIVNKFKPEARKVSSPAGHAGDYRVVFVLSRPGHSPTSDRDVSLDLGPKGDSHMSISPQAAVERRPGDIAQMQVEASHEGRRLTFSCYPNERGFLARIEADLPAPSFADADLAASRAIAPFLSFWSVTQNIPVYIHQTEVTETRTGNRRVTLNMPFYEAPPPPAGQGISTEFLWFAALYRDAMNSNSPLYRFFCLYKIIEGVYVRRSVTKIYPKVRERVPDDENEFNSWLHALFPVRPVKWDAMMLDSVFMPEVRGRSVGDIRDKELRTLRNDVGHLFDETEKNLRMWVDDAEQVRRIHKWLPITTCIARLLMKNEFPREFLPGLAADGTEVPR